MKYSVIPGIVLADIFDEYFLIADIEARRTVPYIQGLNDTGAFLWHMIEEKTDVDEMIARTVRNYEIDIESARMAVNSFMLSLRNVGYLSVEEEMI